jgi:hypothetical protein
MMVPRRHWLLVLAIPLALVTGDLLYWRMVIDRLRNGIEQWEAAQTAQGWTINSDPLSTAGWPLAATVRVPNLRLRHAGATIPGDLTVAPMTVILSVSLLSTDNLKFSLLGPTHLRFGPGGDGAASTPVRRELIVDADTASITVPLTQTGPLSVSFHGSGLSVAPAAGAWRVKAGLLNAEISVAERSGAEQSEPAATFAVSSEAIALPAGFKWPLGQNISSLSLDGQLNGPLPQTREITRWAEAWRDGGGSLEIKHLAVGWGPLGLASSATMALDDQLQPMGSGNGRIVGYADTLDRLAAGGLMTKSAATAAKAVLSLLAGTTDADEPASVDVPLTLQYRTLSMRQVPLIRLPELDWPPR